MHIRSLMGATALAVALLAAHSAFAFDDSKYPNLKGQWERVGNPNWLKTGGDGGVRTLPSPPPGLFTPEYEAVYNANRVEQEGGGTGNVPSTFCFPQGMPMMMNIYDPMEIIVTPETTYILISHVNDSYRRIYTDGRDWPTDPELNFAGYSIGKWIDEDGDGKYDVLEVETRDFKGPRAYDASGLPLSQDNKSVIKERFHLDKNDPNTLYDDMTVYDDALTRPWSITKTAKRNPNPRPKWHTDVCADDNPWVRVEDQAYYRSADGKLMPTKKDQRPPDLRYFKTK